MHDLCPSCGSARTDPEVESGDPGPSIVCPSCGHRESFVRPPLCVVVGAAAAGKSTVCRSLQGDLPAVLLDVDRLRGAAFERTGDPDGTFASHVLSLCRQVAQSGRPPVVFSRTLTPDVLGDPPEARFFDGIEALALVCDGQTHQDRMLSFPGWDPDDRLEVDREFERNRRFREDADAVGVDPLDTTDARVWQTTDAVRAWIEERI